MMLNYTTNKNIVIEARESCRVPVPVERCPLFKREQQTDDQKDQNCKFDLWIAVLQSKLDFNSMFSICRLPSA